MIVSTPWRVVARDHEQRTLFVATRIHDKREAEQLAERWFERTDVGAVDVVPDEQPVRAARRTYR